jgi:carbamoyl-phosphate synthase large subunit
MKPLKILVTGSGAPGIAGTIYSLRNNFDNRPVEIIGTDCNPDAVGRDLCDKFYQIAGIDEIGYLTDLNKILDIERTAVLIPQNTKELEILSSLVVSYRCPIIVSSKRSIGLANDKGMLLDNQFEYLSSYHPKGITNKKSLKKAMIHYGWPNNPVVIKPPISNGMRGFRIIDESFNPKESFYTDKPDNTRTTWKALKKVLGKTFPELLVCEYLPGKEYSVDCFRWGNRIDVIPRERTQIRSGITFAGKLVKHEYIISECKRLAKILDLKYCFGFQFKEDKDGKPQLLECNPRVQGSMVMSTLAGANVIWASVKAALGGDIPEFDIDWNCSFKRYWGGIDNKGIKI